MILQAYFVPRLWGTGSCIELASEIISQVPSVLFNLPGLLFKVCSLQRHWSGSGKRNRQFSSCERKAKKNRKGTMLPREEGSLSQHLWVAVRTPSGSFLHFPTQPTEMQEIKLETRKSFLLFRAMRGDKRLRGSNSIFTAEVLAFDGCCPCTPRPGINQSFKSCLWDWKVISLTKIRNFLQVFQSGSKANSNATFRVVKQLLPECRLENQWNYFTKYMASCPIATVVPVYH